jgi:ribosomal protein S18 acetylase RimI-like enzyme
LFERLENKHINELYKMLNFCQKDEEYFHPHSFDKRYLKSLLKERFNYYFVLIEDNKIIGYSMLRTFGRYPDPTFGGFIHRDYRRRGYGTELLKKTIDKAKELGFKRVLLKVHKDNEKAINLYSKIGFRELEKENDQYWMELIL